MGWIDYKLLNGQKQGIKIKKKMLPALQFSSFSKFDKSSSNEFSAFGNPWRQKFPESGATRPTSFSINLNPTAFVRFCMMRLLRSPRPPEAGLLELVDVEAIAKDDPVAWADVGGGVLIEFKSGGVGAG